MKMFGDIDDEYRSDYDGGGQIKLFGEDYGYIVNSNSSKSTLSEQQIIDICEKIFLNFDYCDDNVFNGIVKIVRAVEKYHGVK